MDPTDIPLWFGHGLTLPEGVEARRGMAADRMVIVLRQVATRVWVAITVEAFVPGRLSLYLARLGVSETP